MIAPYYHNNLYVWFLSNIYNLQCKNSQGTFHDNRIHRVIPSDIPSNSINIFHKQRYHIYCGKIWCYHILRSRHIHSLSSLLGTLYYYWVGPFFLCGMDSTMDSFEILFHVDMIASQNLCKFAKSFGLNQSGYSLSLSSARCFRPQNCRSLDVFCFSHQYFWVDYWLLCLKIPGDLQLQKFSNQSVWRQQSCHGRNHWWHFFFPILMVDVNMNTPDLYLHDFMHCTVTTWLAD